MKYFSILEGPSEEAIKVFAEKRGLAEHLKASYAHPQEDYLIASDSPPIFVVSDGVTLNFKKLIEEDRPYPNPSPAGEVAKIFCKEVERSARDRYTDLSEESIKDIFRKANGAVGEYNQEVGKSDISGNVTGFYATTGSFAVVREGKVYWATVCDAFFAHFDKDMNLKFMSSGSCSPYAVVNGEERMVDYIESGVLALESGDKIFVFTDGFEHYMRDSKFLELFKLWTEDLKEEVETLSQRMNKKDPEKYGHERSLVAVFIT